MNAFRRLNMLPAIGAMLLSSCAVPHGQPRKGAETLAPNEVLDFSSLYAGNCAGCRWR